MKDEITITVIPKPGDKFCACPFCTTLDSALNPNHIWGWIKFTPGNGLFKCDQCGALLVRGIK